MDVDELKEGAREGFRRLKSGVELLCHVVIGVGVLALVVDSWLLLSHGKSREALGLVGGVILGAAGGFIYLEQWISLGQAALHVLGLLLGRASRAQCAKSVAWSLAAAGLWYVLLTYAGPIAMGFGVPAPGMEAQLMWGTFYLMAVYHALGVPERLRMTVLSATVGPAAPGELPPIGGFRN